MLELNPVRLAAKTLDGATFKRRYPGLYLLGSIPMDLDDDWSFSTDIRAFDYADRPTLRSLAPSPAAPEAAAANAIWAVEKSDRNDWRRRISVGRATNNDVVIRHDSLSKLHAHFHYGTLARLGLSRTGELLLTDAGSSNGTYVGARRLLEDETEPVASGARLRFGDVQCQLLDSDALYTTLQKGAW